MTKCVAPPRAVSRRSLLAAALLVLPIGVSRPLGAEAASPADQAFDSGLADLERRHGGRLGVAICDTATATIRLWRGDERFPLCSTWKLIAAFFVLARVDRGQEDLARRISYGRSDLLDHSPITEQHVAEGGMSLGDLCAAAIGQSDNAAGNLLLDSFGGPAPLTAFLASIGDRVTRLDRREPALNAAEPGDPRDTTTPRAMLETMRNALTGLHSADDPGLVEKGPGLSGKSEAVGGTSDERPRQTLASAVLSEASRARALVWMEECRTGDNRLRAGVPRGWRVGDKTGTGAHGATNDVAIVWPPGRAPIVVTAYYAESNAPLAVREAVLAEVGRLAARSRAFSPLGAQAVGGGMR